MSKKLDKQTEAATPRGRIRIKKGGKVATVFSDTEYRRNGDNLEMKYDTTINGRLFHVASVLPVHPASTPMEKVKSYIDLRLENEANLLDFYQNSGYNENTVLACPETEEPSWQAKN